MLHTHGRRRNCDTCSRSQLNIITSAIVREYRRVYGDAIDSVLLYGSYARGDEDDTSDIDVVAIVHGERLSLQEKLKKYGILLQR